MLLSVFIDFPVKTKDALFHYIVFDYYRANWDGFLDLRDSHGRISLILELYLLLPNFMWGSTLELMCISLIVNINSSFIHFNGFQLLMLLPQLIGIAPLAWTNKKKFCV